MSEFVVMGTDAFPWPHENYVVAKNIPTLEEAKKYADAKPDFSDSLRKAMKWYKAAGEIWNRQLGAPVPVDCLNLRRAIFVANTQSWSQL